MGKDKSSLIQERGAVFINALVCYNTSMPDQPPRTQLDKFKEAARALECDDDESRFDDRVRKLVERKPVEKPE